MGRFREALALGSRETEGGSSSTEAGNVRRETVSRTGSTFGNIVGADRINAERVPVPADDIRKYWHMYKTVPFVRSAFNQFRADIMANGYRTEADNEQSEKWLDEWTDTAGVISAVRGQDFYKILDALPIQLLGRGTVMLEHAEAEADETRTAGVSYIHPATVTPYRASDTNLLLRPDDTQYDGVKLTEDGQAAAYVQFDGTDDERRLTLDEVTRITYNADTNAVFGTSAVAPAAERIEAVRDKLRDNDRAVELNAWRSWFLSFDHEIVTNEDGSETIVEWEDDDMDDVVEDLESVEPGDIEGLDGTVEVNEIGGEVADIIDQLQYETHYILLSMPVPTYAVGFEKDINQFVVEGQQDSHHQRVIQFRNRMRRELRPLAKQVLNEADMPSDGARILLEPPEESSPILNLSKSELDSMVKYAEAFEVFASTEGRTLVPDDVLREKFLQLEGIDSEDFDSPEELSEERLQDIIAGNTGTSGDSASGSTPSGSNT